MKRHALVLCAVSLFLGQAASADSGNDHDKKEKEKKEKKLHLQRKDPPLALVSPSLSGETLEGSTLTGDDGEWASRTDLSYARRWLRCDRLGDACVAIAGETGSTHALGRADGGTTLRFEVAATNLAGTTVERSEATAVVRFAPPVNLALPTIYGTPVEGERLTAEAGVWAGEVVGYAFAWERCTALGCAPISGATSSEYVLTRADVGATIAVAVTAEGPDASTSALSLTTESIRYAPPRLVEAPSVEGDAVERGTLTATTGSWDGPVDAFAYQWERCNATGCAPLSGETAATHLLTSADVGATIAVSVTAFGPGGATTARSSESAAVRYAPPLAVSAPTVSGSSKVATTPRDGDTLFATTGTWLGQIDGISLTWWRCAADETDCASVGGGTSHALTEADVGSTFFVEALAQGPGGSSVSRSSTTAPSRAPGRARTWRPRSPGCSPSARRSPPPSVRSTAPARSPAASSGSAVAPTGRAASSCPARPPTAIASSPPTAVRGSACG